MLSDRLFHIDTAEMRAAEGTSSVRYAARLGSSAG